MKSNLKLVSTVDMSHDQWLAYRLNGIGGSEVSAILGLNPYYSSHKLFYQKLGEVDYPAENIHMFWGKEHEDKIAEIWKFHDPNKPDFETTMINRKAGKVVRNNRRVNAYITNPDFNYAFASVDRLINKDDADKEGVLECKTISAFAANVWEAGIPPMYVAQLQYYLMVLDLDYGELATLKDGKYFDVIPFERNNDFIKLIDESCRRFWDLVTRARILKQEGKPFEQLEPEIDNQEAYKLFLTERYNAEAIKVAPAMEYLDLGREYLSVGEDIKELEEKQAEIANRIKAYMKDGDMIDFGAAGKITWKQNKDSVTFDKDKFKSENPGLFDKYIITKPGARVFKVGVKKLEQAVAA